MNGPREFVALYLNLILYNILFRALRSDIPNGAYRSFATDNSLAIPIQLYELQNKKNKNILWVKFITIQ